MMAGMNAAAGRYRLAWLCLWAMLFASPIFAEGIFRWTDANGLVHYGRRPPAGVTAAPLALPAETSAPADVDAAATRDRQQRVLDAYRYERAQKKAANARSEQVRRQRADECRRLQLRWKRLSHGGPIYIKRADGGRDYLSEQERTEHKADMRPAYIAACGEAP